MGVFLSAFHIFGFEMENDFEYLETVSKDKTRREEILSKLRCFSPIKTNEF